MKMTNRFPNNAPLDCALCPRLVGFRKENRTEHPDWFNAPVPNFGQKDAELLIVGLAPGKTGANRTGRPFTGDWAGDLLYPTLDKYGFSKGSYKAVAGDGLVLKRAMITNAVRCVPPENKPVGREISTCRSYLKSSLTDLADLKVIITLGKISHDSTIRAFGLKVGDYPFAHNALFEIESRYQRKIIALISSYHCSRYNTNTGRLTKTMFHDVFKRASDLIRD